MSLTDRKLVLHAVKRDCVKQLLSAPISLQNVQVRNEPIEDETNEADQNDLDQCLDHSYNLFCLFLPESGNLTVWTVSKAIPYFVLEQQMMVPCDRCKSWSHNRCIPVPEREEWEALPFFCYGSTMQKWKGWTWCLNGTIRVVKIVTGGQGCAGDILLHVKHKHDGAAPVPTTSSLQFSLGYQRGLEKRIDGERTGQATHVCLDCTV
ncbi:hypothetical protein Bbelb_406800 [Branchiostoma belcheri]|nr:hypothetical protein Bbelb_406800 [Branchiostoma belcheri]